MDKWDEIKTAYQVAKSGTLSAAAQTLGVHRATVMRHIDALEEKLGIKLFQRNDKGYIPTQAGLEVMKVAQLTDDQFAGLLKRIQTEQADIEGVLQITAVDELSNLLMPIAARYQQQHPKVQIEFIGDLRRFNLEYGEADIAIRAGEKPTTPDNIVFPLRTEEMVFCAHQSYQQRFGLPKSPADFSQHRFLKITQRAETLAWNEWLYENLSSENISVSCTSYRSLMDALTAGCGIGVMPKSAIEERPDLIELDVDFKWQISMWALVHRDIYRVPKVYEFMQLLKQFGDQQPLFPDT